MESQYKGRGKNPHQGMTFFDNLHKKMKTEPVEYNSRASWPFQGQWGQIINYHLINTLHFTGSHVLPWDGFLSYSGR